MTASTLRLFTKTPQLRPLNILRDLPVVADLVELCFGKTLDVEGRSFISQMRKAGHDNAFMRWAVSAVETVSMPLSGFVWEEEGKIIGNVSLIPFSSGGQKIYLIANVVVHPEYRRRGIGHSLTSAAMQLADQKGASATWLHVRADNTGAIRLYEGLGFKEHTRRTTWRAVPDPNALPETRDITITKCKARDWPSQQSWLQRLYPDELAWYQSLPWKALRPGILPALVRLISEQEIRQWAAYQDDQLLGTLTWQSAQRSSDLLWAAVAPRPSEAAFTALLLQARQALSWRTRLTLEFPAGEALAPIGAAGFQAERTLVWMRLTASFHEETRKT